MFASVFKWFLLATVIGLLVGSSTTLFLRTLTESVSFTGASDYFFLLLPVALFVNSFFIYKIFPSANAYSTDRVIESIHSGRDISVVSAVKSFFMPVLTIASGGSAGREAPAADIGAALGSFFGRMLRLNDSDRRKLAICGVSAGFASVFGTPIAGAIFGVEVLFVGGLLYDVLLPSFIAGITAYQVAVKLGITYAYHPISFVPAFSEIFLVRIALAGVFFGIVSFALVEVLKYAKRLNGRINVWYPVKGLIGGTALVVLTFIFSKRYLGLGFETIRESLSGERIEWYAPFLKIIFTAVTLVFGGAGGIITPVLFIGSTSGTLFAGLFGFDASTFAALGLVSLLAGSTNTPIAASIMAIELFGASIAPYAGVACVISFLMTGHRSVYPSQVLAVRKSSAIDIAQGGRMRDAKPEISPRPKNIAKGIAELFKRMKK